MIDLLLLNKFNLITIFKKMEEDEEEDDEEEPGYFKLGFLSITDTTTFEFLRQRSTLRMQVNDVEKQYYRAVEKLQLAVREYQPLNDEFDARFEFLRTALDSRLQRQRHALTKEDVLALMSPDEVRETEDLKFLRSQVVSSSNDIRLLKELVGDINKERIKLHRYLSTMRVAKTIQQITDAMETMRGFDLSASSDHMVAIFNKYAKSTLRVKDIDVQQRKVEIAKERVLAVKNAARPNTDDILELLLKDAEEEIPQLETAPQQEAVPQLETAPPLPQFVRQPQETRCT